MNNIIIITNEDKHKVKNLVDLILKITMKYLIENVSTLKNAVIVCN